MLNQPINVSAQLSYITQLLKDLLNRPDDNKPEDSYSDILTITGASKFLGKSKSCIYALCSQNKIPHNKRGRLYFSKKELTNWINSGKVNTISDYGMIGDRLLNKNKRS